MSVPEKPPASDLSLRDLARFAEGEARHLAATFDFGPGDRDGRVPFALAQAVKLGEEVGELQAEVLGALQYQRSDKASRYNRDTLAGELGDVMVCVALLADAFGVDLAEAVGSKIEHLEARNRRPESAE